MVGCSNTTITFALTLSSLSLLSHRYTGDKCNLSPLSRVFSCILPPKEHVSGDTHACARTHTGTYTYTKMGYPFFWVHFILKTIQQPWFLPDESCQFGVSESEECPFRCNFLSTTVQKRTQNTRIVLHREMPRKR